MAHIPVGSETVALDLACCVCGRPLVARFSSSALRKRRLGDYLTMGQSLGSFCTTTFLACASP